MSTMLLRIVGDKGIRLIHCTTMRSIGRRKKRRDRICSTDSIAEINHPFVERYIVWAMIKGLTLSIRHGKIWRFGVSDFQCSAISWINMLK